MKVVLYNDCLVQGQVHFGCQLVNETFKEQLSRVDIELLGSVTKSHISSNNIDYSLMGKADLILVNGEGSFHHNRRNDLNTIPTQYPSVLMNSLWEANNHCDGMNSYKKIYLRESFSRNALKDVYPDMLTEVVPDVIFTSDRLNSIKSRGALTRSIRHFSDLRTMQPADMFLKSLSMCSTINSESFHGLICAMVLGISIDTVYKSNTFKNESLMYDFKHDSNYVKNAKLKVNSMFENLHNI